MNELMALDNIEKVKSIVADNKNKWIVLIKNSEKILLNMNLKDRLAGMNTYLKGKRDCEQARTDLWEVEEWNKKKIGEHLLKLKKEGELKEGRPKKRLQNETVLGLQNLNTTKKESHEFQKRAFISDTDFQVILDGCKERQDIGKGSALRKIKENYVNSLKKKESDYSGQSFKELPDKKYEIIYCDPAWQYNKDMGYFGRLSA